MQQINLHAIVQNALALKKRVGVPLVAVVKNDAYGHGLVRVANVLRDVVDSFAVATVDEALKIADFDVKIMILLPCLNEAELAVASKRGFVVTLSDFPSLSLAERCGLPLVVQIKVDSGMSRLGFSPKQLPAAVGRIAANKNFDVRGVFSHFWGADKIDCDKQLAEFLPCADYVEQAVGHGVTKHMANTNAALLDEKYRLDAVRVGIGLYGYGADFLTPAKTVTAKVIASRHVAEGCSVGYDAVFCPTVDTNLAVLNVGYAQGLPRVLVGQNIVVSGHAARIVAVCMGMTICDTGDFRSAVGNEAILLGNGVNPSNCDTIVYELLCNLR